MDVRKDHSWRGEAGRHSKDLRRKQADTGVKQRWEDEQLSLHTRIWKQTSDSKG